ncbi:MAG: PP2C family protein-serine/threonine phosphatase [Caldilineaceae bacterium]
MEVQVAVAKINKYASSESGDTVEVVERPHGGLSIVVADGQRSGRSAKLISNMVVRKAISLLAEGVRDGAVARATHDYLVTERGGKVSAELFIVSIDLVTKTLVLSRNARAPGFVHHTEGVQWINSESEAVGIHRNTKPAIHEIALEAGLTVVIATDGVWSAGERSGKLLDMVELVCTSHNLSADSAQRLADTILEETMRLEQNRPHDDATVVVVKISPADSEDKTRRMSIRFPI